MIPALAFRHRLLPAALLPVLLVPASAAGQGTPPAGVGSVTFAWQGIDNTGHLFTDGSFKTGQQSVTTSFLAEVDFGVTDRWAATVAIPFVFARFKGPDDPFSRLPHDACRCWQQSFQDFSIASRYDFGNGIWALVPQVRVILPSHDYEYHGEAVVGLKLNQMLLGISGAWPLAPVLPKATIQAGYTFALVEKAYKDLRLNRSIVTMSVGYALPGSLYVHGGALYQETHGGYTADYLVNHAPLDIKLQSDRLIKARYWHATGGLTYSVGSTDLFFAVEPYVWGRDTHNGIAYTVGASWNFVFFR